MTEAIDIISALSAPLRTAWMILLAWGAFQLVVYRLGRVPAGSRPAHTASPFTRPAAAAGDVRRHNLVTPAAPARTAAAAAPVASTPAAVELGPLAADTTPADATTHAPAAPAARRRRRRAPAPAMETATS